MRTGKISESILKRSVLKMCGPTSPEVIQGPGAGHDSAMISAGEDALLCASAQTVVLDNMKKVGYGVEHAVNNLACSGCLPKAVLLTVLLPQSSGEGDLKAIMQQARMACEALGVAIAGGHTEVSAGVNCPILNVTALGLDRDGGLPAGNIRPGLDMLIAGWIGLEGTRLLVQEHEEELCRKFPVDFVEQTKKYAESISVVEMAREAREAGAVSMHDLSQGGVFGALWEMCQAGPVGLEADLRSIPVKQETIEICEYFGLNPYCLLSGGALLIAAEDGAGMERELAHRGIPARVVGKTTASKDRILHNGEEKRFLDKPGQDELWKHRETAENFGAFGDTQ